MIYKIKGLYLHINWYFFCMLLWASFTGKINMFIMCILALLFHELGHMTVIYALKEKINIFYILPFGFCCRLKNQSRVKKGKMLKILIAGPATSIFVAGLVVFWTKEFALVNFIIGIFNLLPIGNLDGGRLIKLFF